MRPETVHSFANDLETLLEKPFSRSEREGFWLLRSADLACTIVLYLPGKTERIPVSDGRVFHIDAEQIADQRNKLLGRLAALFGKGRAVHARQTIAARIDKKMALSFQQEHHLQVALPGKYRYGLFRDGELVSVAVFGGGRRMNGRPDGYRSFELLRFCHKSGLRVVGGLSKLIRAFGRDFRPGDIMTYVDRDWSRDSNLRTIGFSAVGELPPQRFWASGGTRHPIRSAEDLARLRKIHPSGCLKENSGSVKMVLPLADSGKS